jgi:hypothetical protein
MLVEEVLRQLRDGGFPNEGRCGRSLRVFAATLLLDGAGRIRFVFVVELCADAGRIGVTGCVEPKDVPHILVCRRLLDDSAEVFRGA